MSAARLAAGPGVKGGHFSDARIPVSSGHPSRPAGAAKSLFFLDRRRFFATFCRRFRFAGRNYVSRHLGGLLRGFRLFGCRLLGPLRLFELLELRFVEVPLGGRRL